MPNQFTDSIAKQLEAWDRLSPLPGLMVADANDCWNWQSALNDTGYATVSHRNKSIRVSRWILGIHGLPWRGPDGVVARHVCDNPACVRPSHLEVGTNSDNSRDKYRRGRRSEAGEHNNHAALTEAEVRIILFDYLEWVDGRPEYVYKGQCRDIAGDFGIRESTVSRIKNGHRWRHLWPLSYHNPGSLSIGD